MPVVFVDNKEIPSSSKNYTKDVLKYLCEADNDIDSSVCSNLFKLKKNHMRGLKTGQIVIIIMTCLAGSVLLCYFFARFYSRY